MEIFSLLSSDYDDDVSELLSQLKHLFPATVRYFLKQPEIIILIEEINGNKQVVGDYSNIEEALEFFCSIVDEHCDSLSNTEKNVVSVLEYSEERMILRMRVNGYENDTVLHNYEVLYRVEVIKNSEWFSFVQSEFLSD